MDAAFDTDYWQRGVQFEYIRGRVGEGSDSCKQTDNRPCLYLNQDCAQLLGVEEEDEEEGGVAVWQLCRQA